MLASARGEAHDREVPVDAILQSFEEDMDATRDLIDSHPKFDVRKYSDGDIYDAIYVACQSLRASNPARVHNLSDVRVRQLTDQYFDLVRRRRFQLPMTEYEERFLELVAASIEEHGDVYAAMEELARLEENPNPQRFLRWFTDTRPWGLAQHATTMADDDTITLLFVPWADSPNKPRWGLPKSHPGVKHLLQEIPKRAAMEGVHLVPVGARTDFEQSDFGVGERGDQPAARGRIFLTFKRVDAQQRERNPQQRRRERNPGTTAGDLVRQLKF